MSACEKCWRDACWRALNLGGFTADHYHDLLRERKDHPCTPEEQRGEENREPDLPEASPVRCETKTEGQVPAVPKNVARGATMQPPLIDDANPRPAAEDQAPEAEGLLYCRTCWNYTTRLEAELRVFNTGRCAHCNSELTPVSHVGAKP